jgi:hypothetical protein
MGLDCNHTLSIEIIYNIHLIISDSDQIQIKIWSIDRPSWHLFFNKRKGKGKEERKRKGIDHGQ